MEEPAFAAKIRESTAPYAAYGPWLLRIGLAAIILYHGLEKVRGGTPPQEGLDMMFQGSSLVFWLVALGEVGAGLGIIIGGFKVPMADLLTRFSGLVIAIIMAGAIFTIHLPEWHFMRGGAEMQTLVALTGLFFALRGNQ